MPNAEPRPTGEALIVAVPEAKFRWQITLGTAGASDPKYRLDKQAIICGSASRVALLSRQHCFDSLELIAPQPKTHHLDIRPKARI